MLACHAGGPGSIPGRCKLFLVIWQTQSWGKSFGGAGYRSRYLSHAKRALYHLSYAPIDDVYSSFLITVLAYMYLVWLLWRSPSNSTKLYTLVIILHLCYVSFDSSVGRAVDCSCTLSVIHRSLVQIRLEGIFVMAKNCFPQVWHIHNTKISLVCLTKGHWPIHYRSPGSSVGRALGF